MATYIQGVTDEFGQIVPYTPNWNFLERVYASGQAKYDQGFAKVKSLYNSLLNSPVTNAENEQFRKDMFRKLQQSLRSVSAVDLSDPTNVMKAKSLLDPLSEDQELVYDIQVTKHHQQQKALMEQYKNSTDPDKRAMYSEYSAMDIGFAEQDLKNAKRGDGSITQVTPRDFTPFDDVMKYLREAAKDANLEIIQEGPAGGGYILKRTNGQQAYMPFTQWAMATMGTRFDRQFQVMGRVAGETQIRNMMEQQGVSRQDAINLISTELAKKLSGDKDKEANESTSTLAEVENKIKTYNELYPNGIPLDRPEIKEEYMELLAAKELHQKTAKNARLEKDKIDSDPGYVASNIYNFLTGQAMQSTAMEWAVSTADATEKVETSADQVWLTKFQVASREKLQRMKMEQDERHHREKMELDILKAKNKGELPSEEYMGTYTPKEVMTGSEILEKDYHNTRNQMYNKVFGAEGTDGGSGLINLALGEKEEYSKYEPAIAKLNKMANGEQVSITDNDMKLVKSYYASIGGRDASAVAVPTTAAEAAAVVDNLMEKTYTFAADKLAMYQASGKSHKARQYYETFDGVFTDMRTLVQRSENIDKNYKQIAQVVQDPSYSELYENAKVISYLNDGTPVYDLSGVSEAGKKHLDNVISSEYTARANPYGNVYNFSGLSGAELYQMVHADDAQIEYGDEASRMDITTLRGLGTAPLKDLFGDEMKVMFNPVTEEVIVSGIADPTSSAAKQIGYDRAGEEIRVKIPYKSISSSRGALSRLQKYLDMNSVNPDSYGLFEVFASDPTASVSAPLPMQKSGFNWTLTGTTNPQGERGLYFTNKIFNPETKTLESMNTRFFKVDFTDPNTFTKTSKYINSLWHEYSKQVHAYELSRLN